VAAGPEIVEEGVQEVKKAEEEPIDDARQVKLLSENMRGLINNEMFRSVPTTHAPCQQLVRGHLG